MGKELPFQGERLRSLYAIYQTFRVSREIPLKSSTQVLKIILYCTGMVLAVSVALDRSPVYLISGLGAMTAVLMLVFKDPIMGFVAGIQLISNRMLKNGDWIEMPKYEADGDVIDITLTTVKVRNWDNTITTIPTYALINDSFKNWRGMQESQGRRIKRAIHIGIFDHLLAIVPEFGLKVYQYPSGSDVERLVPAAGR